MQISTRPKAKGSFARATENNVEEALISGATITFTHLVSGQFLGLGSGLGLGFSSGGVDQRDFDWGNFDREILICHHREGIIVL